MVYVTGMAVRLTLNCHACKVVCISGAHGPGEQEDTMTSEKRAKGKQIRKVEKLDKAWREGGKQEGRTENDLAMHLGRAARAGLGAKSRHAQNRSAARLGQRSGWER